MQRRWQKSPRVAKERKEVKRARDSQAHQEQDRPRQLRGGYYAEWHDVLKTFWPRKNRRQVNLLNFISQGKFAAKRHRNFYDTGLRHRVLEINILDSESVTVLI